MADIKEKNTKLKNKKNKKTFFIVTVLLIAAVFIGLYVIVHNSDANTGVETAMIGTVEEKKAVVGYIIRDESVVTATETGVVSFRADEGERVSKGSEVAVIYSGDVSDEVKNELSTIHLRISEMEGSSIEKDLSAGDAVGIDTQVKNDIELVSRAVYSGDVSSVIQHKDDIIRIIRVNVDGEKPQTTVEKLQSRRAELEGSISGKTTTVYSNTAGVMCSRLDGCEEYFHVSNIDSITPQYLSDCPQPTVYGPASVTKDMPCLKIINNYEWYFATTVDEVWFEGVKEGHVVKLRFSDISDDTYEGTVHRISEPLNGKVSVVIKSRSMFPGMYTTRVANAEVIKNTYKGFKVSKNAVHIDENGNYYVYINSEGAKRKRDVTVLYADEAYVIIKEDNSAPNNILLYDEVIISGKDGGK